MNGFTQIRVVNATNELGDVFEEHGVIKTKFDLINPYESDTIHIVSIETSCGCTAVLSQDTLIKPQSKIELLISYDPTGRKGLFGKSIKVETITGKSERNTLYLKITGNVISADNKVDVKPSLVEYKVAPIYFYPVTEYDTSYLDFSHIINFVNSLTYEVDYFQFAKVGIELKIRDKSKIEALEYLIRFSKYKLLRQIKRSGYGTNRLFFGEPSFVLDDSIPKWSVAEIKAFSINFNDDSLSESQVSLTNKKNDGYSPYLLDYKSNNPLNIDSIMTRIDFRKLKQNFMLDSVIELNLSYKIPESASLKTAKQLEQNIKKAILKKFKIEYGIGKKEVKFIFDQKNLHASTYYHLKLWKEEDIQQDVKVAYQIKEEELIKPNLPTYKQSMFYFTDSLNISAVDFKHFWSALTTYYNLDKDVKIILESYSSYYPRSLNTDQLYLSRQKAVRVQKQFIDLFYQKTGDSLDVEVKNILQGPNYLKKHFSKADYIEFEYIKFVPVYKNERKIYKSPVNPMPYIVNYDYYFKALDTNSFVFKKFAKYVMYEIQNHGYVEIKTESSQSNIPVEKHLPNHVIAYNHLYESKKLLFDYLKNHLVDPNRVVISEERIMVQGIPYSRKTPVLRYRPFQYITFVPAKYLKSKK
jgi:hypothetical protein